MEDAVYIGTNEGSSSYPVARPECRSTPTERTDGYTQDTEPVAEDIPDEGEYGGFGPNLQADADANGTDEPAAQEKPILANCFEGSVQNTSQHSAIPSTSVRTEQPLPHPQSTTQTPPDTPPPSSTRV